jgi:predicted phosphate transport protein (TIGR00153 family)
MKALEAEVDQFLDQITKGTLCMREALRFYLSGDDEGFASRLERVREHEHRADELRKSVKSALYTYSLIPESSADVMELLETLDDVIDCAKHILEEFEVQSPDVEIGFLDQFAELASQSVHAVEHVVDAARCFFHDERGLRDCIIKVEFYETEVDATNLRLKKMIYESDMDLARKHHLRYFADSLASLSDIAEGVGESLVIAAIKRNA